MYVYVVLMGNGFTVHYYLLLTPTPRSNTDRSITLGVGAPSTMKQ